MSRIVVQAFITLDGVVQGPGGPDEDRDGGFEHGGWTEAFDEGLDESEAGFVGEWESRAEALLLGRRTYELFAGSWGVADEKAEGPIGDWVRRYNRIPKYVASRTRTDLGWDNSQVLGPDVPAAVEKLRAGPGGEIHVWGSTELIRTLAGHDLIDEYRLVVYPLVLGTGKKLFADGFTLSRFALAESRALSSGVLVTVYRPARAA